MKATHLNRLLVATLCLQTVLSSAMASNLCQDDSQDEVPALGQHSGVPVPTFSSDVETLGGAASHKRARGKQDRESASNKRTHSKDHHFSSAKQAAKELITLRQGVLPSSSSSEHVLSIPDFDSFTPTMIPSSVQKSLNDAHQYFTQGSDARDAATRQFAFRKCAELYDKLLRDDSISLTQDDLRRTVADYRQMSVIYKEPAQKLAVWQGIAALYDRIFIGSPVSVTHEDLSGAALAHYAMGTLFQGFDQKDAVFTRAVALYDKLLTAYPTFVTHVDLRAAAEAHCQLGVFSQGQTQKQASFIRAAALYDQLLQNPSTSLTQVDVRNAAVARRWLDRSSEHPKRNASYADFLVLLNGQMAAPPASQEQDALIRTAFHRYCTAGHYFEPAEKRVAYESAIKLYEQVLPLLDMTTFKAQDTLRNAAQAYQDLGRYSESVSQKQDAYKKAIALYKELLVYGSASWKSHHLKGAANTYYNLGISCESLDEKQEAYARAAELYEELMIIDPKPLTGEDLRNAKQAIRALSFLRGFAQDSSQKQAILERACVFYDKIRRDLSGYMRPNSLKKAANTYYELGVSCESFDKKQEALNKAVGLYAQLLGVPPRAVTLDQDDLRRAANTHHILGNYDQDSVQKRAAFTRVASIYDRLFKDHPTSSTHDDLKKAAAVHTNLLKGAKNPSQKHASLTRATALYDQLVQSSGSQCSISELSKIRKFYLDNNFILKAHQVQDLIDLKSSSTSDSSGGLSSSSS